MPDQTAQHNTQPPQVSGGERHLTSGEQKILHKALRASLKIVEDGSGAAAERAAITSWLREQADKIRYSQYDQHRREKAGVYDEIADKLALRVYQK